MLSSEAQYSRELYLNSKYSSIIKIIISILYLFSQANLASENKSFNSFNRNISEPSNIEATVELIKKSSQDQLSITDFMNRILFNKKDRSFLLNKIIQYKLEKSLVPKIKVAKSSDTYKFSFKNVQILKINKYKPNLVIINGKNLNLDKLKNISQIYNESQNALLISTTTSVIDLLIPKSQAFELITLLIIVSILASIGNDFYKYSKIHGITDDYEGMINRLNIVDIDCKDKKISKIYYKTEMYKNPLNLNINYNENELSSLNLFVQVDSTNSYSTNLNCTVPINNKGDLGELDSTCNTLVDAIINSMQGVQSYAKTGEDRNWRKSMRGKAKTLLNVIAAFDFINSECKSNKAKNRFSSHFNEIQIKLKADGELEINNESAK